MTYNEISHSVRLFFGAREFFRKLGFKADDLFFIPAKSAEDGTIHIFCTLRTQDKVFDVDCGQAEKDAEEMLKEYADVGEAINSHVMSDADLRRIWDESGIPEHTVEFLAALVGKGFHLPCGVWHLS